MLLGGDVSFAVYHYINRIHLRVVHRGKVCVFCKHDGHRTRMVGQVFLDPLIWLQYVDGENDEILVLEFFGDVIDELGLFFAVLTPGSPELEQRRPCPSRIRY